MGLAANSIPPLVHHWGEECFLLPNQSFLGFSFLELRPFQKWFQSVTLEVPAPLKLSRLQLAFVALEVAHLRHLRANRFGDYGCGLNQQKLYMEKL